MQVARTEVELVDLARQVDGEVEELLGLEQTLERERDRHVPERLREAIQTIPELGEEEVERPARERQRRLGSPWQR